MKHVWRISLGLALAIPMLSGSAAAQASAHAATGTTSDNAAALVGTWEGKYTSDHAPSAPMRLAIAHDKEWSARLEISMGDAQMQSVPVRNVTYSSSGLSFTLDLMEQACAAQAAVKENALRGTVTCGQGSIAFLLTKQEK